jgi:hypothetical protein
LRWGEVRFRHAGPSTLAQDKLQPASRFASVKLQRVAWIPASAGMTQEKKVNVEATHSKSVGLQPTLA